MIDPSQLSRPALEDTLGQIVDRLFLDLNPLDCPAELRDRDVYNPEKLCDVDDLEFIADLLRAAGLGPACLGDAPRPAPADPPRPPEEAE